jgi:molecular chaperone IbpA
MTSNLFSLFDPSSFNTLTKSAVGFDDAFKRLADFAETLPKAVAYPPYNIRKTGENTYTIEIAVAGFGKQDIELVLEDNVLTIKGSITSDDANSYLYKGIADRAFTRKFTLADTVEVKNADLINGMLKIWLERFIPESKKPRKIDINTNEGSDIATEANEAKSFLSKKSVA